MKPVLPDTSEDACERILAPHHARLWEIAAGGLACFRSLPPEHQLILSSTKRTHRTTVWQYMMWEAERLLSEVPGVIALHEFEGTTYEFGKRVLVRFKKLDAEGFSSNYRTARAQSFICDSQFEMFEDLWSAPIRVDVGYVLDGTGLSAARILVVRRLGEEIDWLYEIAAPANATLVVPIRPVPPIVPETGTRIVARKDLARVLRFRDKRRS